MQGWNHNVSNPEGSAVLLVQQHVHASRIAHQQAQHQVVALQARVANLQTNNTNLTQTLTASIENVKVKDVRIADLDQRVNTLTVDKGALEGTVGALQGEVEQLRNELADLRKLKTEDDDTYSRMVQAFESIKLTVNATPIKGTIVHTSFTIYPISTVEYIISFLSLFFLPFLKP